MAERLENITLPFKKIVKKDFPFDEWLDGATWLLTAGQDFAFSTGWMTNVLKRVAKDRGLKVRTSAKDGSFYIQAYKADTDVPLITGAGSENVVDFPTAVAS